MLWDAGRRGPHSGILCQHPIHLEEVGPTFLGIVEREDLKVNLIVLEGKKVGQGYLRESNVILLVLEDHEESKVVLQ
jgi:hypothetical protein